MSTSTDPTDVGRRSTAEARRPGVVTNAIETFARGGWAGTTVADVATAAGISTAYVLKLYPTKERLFVAALTECFDRIEAVLVAAADAAPGRPDAALDAMAEAYARLIADRSLLLLQVHALSASTVPAIDAALRNGMARLVTMVSTRSGAEDAAVQRFFAFGQLCHLMVTTGIITDDSPWARILTAGFRHFDPAASARS